MSPLTHLEDLSKNVFLHLCVMHTNRTPSNFDAIQNEVVMLATHLQKRIFSLRAKAMWCSTMAETHLGNPTIIHFLDVFPHWCRKWMMRAAPASMRKELFVRVGSRE